MMPEGTFCPQNPRASHLHDILDIEGKLEPLPIEAMRQLARHFTDPALNRRCRGERNARFRDLAQTYAGDSPGELARLTHSDLRRYAASTWRFERGRSLPADAPQRRQLQHRILALTDGWVPSERTIERALLARLSEPVPESLLASAGAKIGQDLAQHRRQSLSRTTEGDERGVEGNRTHGRQNRRRDRAGNGDLG
jgi:hypothetical protein